MDYAWPREHMERLNAEYCACGYDVAFRRAPVNAMTWPGIFEGAPFRPALRAQ